MVEFDRAALNLCYELFAAEPRLNWPASCSGRSHGDSSIDRTRQYATVLE